ncbi:trichothecene 3-O-acetyltransferase [Schizosaccharomyces japonicus yFS275]|uniref:Trichothecene 3-O-acetyltransferase n=1 Tax=Schizosaccharomyces japonicus (strain yFS275 / FY16936) TaxID=402676 RepID=B6K1L6_SCHJY|nr:trichothecene 3-O-acetyltransferase [Schizosaccharomyces japonicus yFS275]XP_002173340.2 trichothecene 3-O-acetyltransferase [Schizosaccharomyces japonicus yFS275]EEB05031.1 trichothecene 3-O-acetyltransferase [Schizosaccharomyces japonicus yFS275]EEB07047.2 trichothecene 3-O-acetyltransferase [Schizosaccharomyces japonicus yFS275]
MTSALDFLGQLPGTLYTQLCLCYGVEDSIPYPRLLKTIKDGLQRLAAAFPWVTGELITEPAGNGRSGIRKIRYSGKIPFTVKDLRNNSDMPTMNELRRTNFPFRSLDENLIAPCDSVAYSESTSDSESNAEPVFLVQANIIIGGLVLTCVAHHSVMDMTAQGEVVRLLSKACHGIPFSSEELENDDLLKRTPIPMLQELEEPETELAPQLREPSESHYLCSGTKFNPTLPSTAKCSWKYFLFSQAALDDIKMLASSALSNTGKFVSTDDSLTAFISQAVVRARMHRLEPTEDISICRFVNVRSILNIPRTHPGFLINATYTTQAAGKMATELLGHVALQFRSALEPSDLEHRTRALATYLHKNEDKSAFSFGAKIDRSKGLMLSSWAKCKIYGLDFNLGLGTPEAVRRAQDQPFEGFGYLMPKAPNGEIALAICLRDEDMQHLKTDAKFMKYAKYVD